MENKDVEKKLQESADNVQVREFSAVWENIKDRITPVRKKRRRCWLPALVSVVCGVAICAVAVPIALQNTGEKPIVDNSSSSAPALPPTYLRDDLLLKNVPLNEFIAGIEGAEIDCFDYTKYVVVLSGLYRTSQEEVKGGKLEVTDDEENSTMYLVAQFYEEDVYVKENENLVYEQKYSAENAVFEYNLKESYPAERFYVYEIKTEYAGTQYFMEYTCMTEDITPFLNAFFE